MLRILVIALVALVAVMFLLPRPDVPPPIEVATVLDAPRDLPAVALTDADGRPFEIGDLAGRHALVFFGFTNCPDICPITLAVIAEAVDTLREAAPALVPEVLFVSVDPARDSPERIRAYVRGFDESFIGATASEPALEPLLATLHVTVHKEVVDDAVYNVVHNGTIFVLDDAGRWIALFGGSSHRPEIIVGDYLALRASDPRG
jgi:protein SCO1/2